MTDGDALEKAYKNTLSDYKTWDQKDHSSEWILLPDNIGKRLSIDETSLQNDLFTFLSNKDGHCRKGSIVAAVRGTKASDVISILQKIPEEKRLAVKEVTMDLSETMRTIVETVFPNATIVLDCFHIIKRCNDATEEMRLRFKREEQVEQRRQMREFREKKKRNAAHRRWYRNTHPKKYKGKKRGRKPSRINEKYRPEVLENGDTVMEMLTRSKNALSQSADKWSEKQNVRMKLLFDKFHKLKECYDIVNHLRVIFRSKTLTKETAREKLQEWYQEVAQCPIREIKAARDAIKSREDNITNYFINRSSNAAAESLNSKMKAFRAQLRGVTDLPFFMYRLSKIFG